LTVHAWAAQLNVVDRAQHAILSAAEREAAARFRSAAARWQYIARHCWMRWILAGYLQCRPAEVPLITGAHGKPSLAGIADLHFNLTRSGARAVLVVVRSYATVRVGVDLEPVRQFDWADQIVAGMFTAREERVWQTLGPKDGGERALRFALWWTAKEAWLKAIGLGVQARLDSLDASTLTPFDVQRWFSIRAGLPSNVLHAQAPAASAQWSLLAFEPFPDYLGMLVLGIGGDPTASECAIVTDIASKSMGAGTVHGHSEPS
jgi:4'-phosphopantetheinyl transferase